MTVAACIPASPASRSPTPPAGPSASPPGSPRRRRRPPTSSAVLRDLACARRPRPRHEATESALDQCERRRSEEIEPTCPDTGAKTPIGAQAADPALYPRLRRARVKRAPQQPLIRLPHTLSEITGPVYGHSILRPADDDLTRQHTGEPLGERIIVAGRVIDEDGRPVPDTLVEIWQGNAAGRYIHARDQHPAPLDPNFRGAGRCVTDDEGRYRFVTIKPGAYPWRNHPNAWRPAHIHFSLFGPAFVTRLVTQMYFPGDPLIPLDPIFNARARPDGARSAWSPPSISRRPSRNGRSATASTSCCAAATQTPPGS